MKKIIFIPIILILITACTGNKITSDPIISPEEIYTGSDGLVMNFLTNAPPAEAFENSYAGFGLKLENKGAYDIENGYLAISLETDYIDSIRSSLKSTSRYIDFSDYEHITFDLNGKSIESLEGDKDVLTFTLMTKELEELSQTHTTTIAVTSCYEYRTTVSETVCIDSDVNNLKERTKSCTVAPNTLNSQGAPIVVTKIEPKMIPKERGVEPQFKIRIENKAGGLPVQKESIIDACYSRALNYDKINKIEVSAYLAQKDTRIKLDCNVDTNMKTVFPVLKNNVAEITCRYDEGISEEDGTYQSILIIEADYGYTDTISQNIVINKIA